MNQKHVKKILLCSIILIIGLFYGSGINEYLTLQNVQSNLTSLRAYHQDNPIGVTAMFVGIYIALTSLSIPGTIFLTLMSGAIFGTLYGTILVTLSSAFGATMAFLMSRYLFRENVQKRFSEKLSEFNKKFEAHGSVYLFTLRMIPASPYVVINLLMGLTNIKTINFTIFTFLGMLPGTFVYVMAGKKIAEIKDSADVLSLEIILALCLLGLMPLIVKLFSKPQKLVRNSYQ